MSPESYHAQNAVAWVRVPDYPRAITQMKALLGYSKTQRNHACLAYYHACNGDWSAAATEYANAIRLNPNPQYLLAQAEAEGKRGNLEEARKLLVTAEMIQDPPDVQLVREANELRRELGIS